MTETARNIWKETQSEAANAALPSKTKRTFLEALENARNTGAKWFIWRGQQHWVSHPASYSPDIVVLEAK